MPAAHKSPLGEVAPGAHTLPGVGTHVPLQALLESPASLPKWPLGHRAHELDPDEEVNRPTGHRSHPVAPGEEEN